MMKAIIACSTALSAVVFILPAWAQPHYSPSTNSFERGFSFGSTTSQARISTDAQATGSGGVPCNPNTFWANAGNDIVEFTLTGTTIANAGVSYSCGLYRSAIFADNSTGPTSFSPTFFSTDNQGYFTMFAYTGTGWSAVGSDTSLVFYNGGGSGNHIYVNGNPASIGSNVPATRIFHYSQGVFSTVYTTTANRIIAVADQAADQAGNGYFFVGPFPPLSVDTLVAVSPTGTILKKYPVSFDSNGAYGCFMMGNTIYVGLGAGNPVSPSSLLPITLSGNSATLGAPIPFPGSGLYIDLESCNQGNPLGVPGIAGGAAISVGPNPVHDRLHVAVSVNGPSDLRYDILDMAGKTLKSHSHGQFAGEIRWSVDCEALAPGVYFLQLMLDGERFVRKVVKQ